MKKCPQCGREYPEDNKFCNICGSRLSDVQTKGSQSRVYIWNKNQSGAESQQINQETNGYGQQESYGDPSYSQKTSIGAQGYSGQREPVNQNYKKKERPQHGPSAKKPKKKLGLVVKIGVAVATAVMLAVIGIVVLRGIGSRNGESVIYMPNDYSYYYCSNNMKEDEGIRFPFSYVDDDYFYDVVKFSPGGKYVYFFQTYDKDNSAGELWRCEYKKLGSDSSQNEKYFEKICSDVYYNHMGFYLPDDESVVYITGNGEVKYFNGKTTYYIADASQLYYIEGENRIIYEIGDYGSGFDLYGVALKNPDEKILLAKDYTMLCSTPDFDNIIYEVRIGDEEDDEWALYVTGFGKKPEKIGQSPMRSFFYDSETAYQTEKNGNKAKISDWFITDGISSEVLSTLENELMSGTTYKTLRSYKDGKCSVISDRIIGEGSNMGDCLLYFESNQMKTLSLADRSADEILKEIEDNTEELFYGSCIFVYSPISGKSVQFTYDAYQSLCGAIDSSDWSEASFYITETDALLEVGEKLYAAKIQDGKMQPFSLVTENGKILNRNASMFYYGDDYQPDGDSGYYTSVYSYQKGESKCIVSDIRNKGWGCKYYEDGCLLVDKKNKSEQGNNYVFIDNDGISYEFGDVKFFTRIGEKKFLYRKDGDLWVYENGKSNVVAHDVMRFWVSDSVQEKYDYTIF